MTETIITTTTTTVTTKVETVVPTIKTTHVAFIVDESGSMSNAKNIVLNNFKEQVQMLAEQASNNHKVKVSLTTFNSALSFVYEGVDVGVVKYLTESDYNPTGGTALYDAVGTTISKIKEVEDLNNPDLSILLIILSDGEENSSKRFNQMEIKQQITELKASGKWTVTYMGPNTVDLETTSNTFNIAKGNISTFDVTSLAGYQGASKTTLDATKGYMSTRSSSNISNYAETDFFSKLGK